MISVEEEITLIFTHYQTNHIYYSHMISQAVYSVHHILPGA